MKVTLSIDDEGADAVPRIVTLSISPALDALGVDEGGAPAVRTVDLAVDEDGFRPLLPKGV